MFIKREFPTVLEECFQTSIEGAIYAEIIDRLRAEGAIRPAVVDTSSLVHTDSLPDSPAVSQARRYSLRD